MKKLSPFQAAKQLNKLMLRSEYTFFSEGRFWTIRQIPLQKKVNLARAGVDCFTRRIHPWAAPTGLMIEPADVCNLNCIGCWTNDDERRGRVRFLALDGFRRIMDDLGDRLFVIWLWGWGEPFLNRNIYDMIRLAREKDIVVISSTNANLNWDRHEAEALVKSGLSQLIVALDGLDQPTYAKYRVGGHLDKVFANLALVQEARRRLNLATPLINLRMVVMRHNQDQTDEFLALGRSLGVDIVSFKTMCDYRKDGQNTEFPTIRKFQRYAMDQETGRFLDTGQKIYCDRPWKRAHVFADGDITPCEFDMRREFRLGHLTQEINLGKCWTSDVARRFRRMFLNDIRQISFCRFCPYKDQVVWDPTVEYHHLSEAAAGR